VPATVPDPIASKLAIVLHEKGDSAISGSGPRLSGILDVLDVSVPSVGIVEQAGEPA
jgi:hypothetical protein